MILFASIISRLPSSFVTSVRNIILGQLQWWVLLLMVLGALAIIVLIVFVNDSERRIPCLLYTSTPKAGCELMIKVLKSAMANAEKMCIRDRPGGGHSSLIRRDT